MKLLRSISLIAGVAFAAAACDGGSPAAPEVGVLEVDANRTTAPGQLFFFNDGGLTRSYPQSPCQGATPHRDFDFWVGEWEVFNPNGSMAGTNRIIPMLDGCMVEENWTGASGGQGRSMNAYDAATDTWSQYWMDQFGLHLRLEGGLVDGKMVLQGLRQFTPTFVVLDRITWTPRPNGDVNQFWDISVDGGDTFPFLAFDGMYVSTPGVQAAPPAVTNLCPNPEYRELDFLTGDWTARTSAGVDVGAAHVRVDMQGCMLEADFATHKGYESQSFFAWDASTGNWYRNYMDTEGVRLKMSGGLRGADMVLETVRPRSGNKQLHIRVTIGAEGPDRVVERWATSADGVTWTPGATIVFERS